ncbi:acetyl esterase/lipase [Novosphingobium sp. PhB165]|uniref:alpha/beta hydrolase n=1 Tax=Novosphingobium sp. PhB165 TaxID=2485105 RepID=UPI0010F32046|nr:alpha/beta hydrolase [Novosphingobium sp. PhB165]TCM14228.1 acetyl esterase/lipase [Novosphingobium sp. PhB165]
MNNGDRIDSLTWEGESGSVALSRRGILGLSAAFVGTVGALPAKAREMTQAASAPPDGAVHLPARTIAPPLSISDAARAYLRKGADNPLEPYPPVSDAAAWRKKIADHDAGMLRMMNDGDLVLPGFTVEDRMIGAAKVYVITPPASAPNQGKPHLSIHGGGWTSLGGKIARVLSQVQAQQYGGIVYAVDYRMPPDHPFPVPLDDCLAVYRDMVGRYHPDRILVSGGSAGSNLAAALMLKARDAGLPRPGALLLDTPIVDLTGAGDSLQTNQHLDTLLKVWSQDANVALYAGRANLSDPYLSPLKGDLSRGFPPTYLRTGTRDLFLSDTVRFHAALRKAGVVADLYVGEAMPHGGFGGSTPEDADAVADALRWLAKHWM